MLVCCNRGFRGIFRRVLAMRTDFYRRVEFGICPVCGSYKYIDYREFYNGQESVKELSGKEAEHAYEKIEEKLKYEKYGSKSNQNFCFGDFRKTTRQDKNGNPVYLQLKKNFNNEEQVLGVVETRVYKIEDRDFRNK